MRRYTIEFVSEPLDERELVRLIEKNHTVMNLTVIKQELPELVSLQATQTRQKAIQARIKAILSDGKLWQRNAVVASFRESYPDLAIDRALNSLVKAGTISKPHHGIYERAISKRMAMDADKPRRRSSAGESYHGLLERLTRPHTVSELAEAQQVSPQRILQILTRPLAHGAVKRIDLRDKGVRKPHYVRADYLDRSDGSPQDRPLGERDRRLLSALAEHRLTLVFDAARIAGLEKNAGRSVAERLREQGLVSIYRIGMHVFLQIMPAGLSHPEYSASSRKCRPARFLNYLGSTRCVLITLLGRLGAVRAQNLTAALKGSPEIAADKTTGDALRLLLGGGLVEKVQRDQTRYSLYRLTEKGALVTEHIGRFEPQLLPPKSTVRQAHTGHP